MRPQLSLPSITLHSSPRSSYQRHHGGGCNHPIGLRRRGLGRSLILVDGRKRHCRGTRQWSSNMNTLFTAPSSEQVYVWSPANALCNGNEHNAVIGITHADGAGVERHRARPRCPCGRVSVRSDACAPSKGCSAHKCAASSAPWLMHSYGRLFPSKSCAERKRAISSSVSKASKLRVDRATSVNSYRQTSLDRGVQAIALVTVSIRTYA